MGKRVIDLIGSQLKRNIYYCVFAVIAGIMIAYTLVADVRRVPDAADMGTEKEERVNVLVMGTDRQASLCDVMMLVSIGSHMGRPSARASIPYDIPRNKNPAIIGIVCGNAALRATVILLFFICGNTFQYHGQVLLRARFDLL